MDAQAVPCRRNSTGKVIMKNEKVTNHTFGHEQVSFAPESFPAETLIRFPEVQRMVGKPSRSTLYRWIRNGRFPKSFLIGQNISVWKESSILAWIRSKTT